jgi:diguanylate cyclase (GGDEF)-like protein
MQPVGDEKLVPAVAYPDILRVSTALQQASTFGGACELVVEHLARSVPMGLWAITRVVGDVQTMLTVSSPGYAISVGHELPFPTSLCLQMTSLLGPPVIADISSIPVYVAAARATAAHDLPVRAYAGVPIFGPDAELFGTLCGYSPNPEPALTGDVEATLVLLAALLAAMLAGDLALTQAARDVEHARSAADTDELTGLLNRRGWTRFLELEEARYRRFGDPAGIVVLDLDHLKNINDLHGHHEGDRTLRDTARILQVNTRAVDIVARLGGDEFGIITVGAADTHTAILTKRLRQAFDEVGVQMSIGHASHTVNGGFRDAWHTADQRMYADKQQRRPPAG